MSDDADIKLLNRKVENILRLFEHIAMYPNLRKILTPYEYNQLWVEIHKLRNKNE